MNQQANSNERLVKVEVQLEGLREQQKAHAQDTRSRFEDVDSKLDTVIETLNKGKGAFAFALITAGTIGGLVTKGLAALYGKMQ